MHIDSFDLLFSTPSTSTIDSRPRSIPDPLSAGKVLCMQRFRGAIDVRTTPEFAAALARIADRDVDGIVLDLSGVAFLGAGGLATMSRFLRESAQRHVPVALVCGRSVARPIEACGFDALVSLCTSLDEAETVLSRTIRS